jgi:hypothetical protein
MPRFSQLSLPRYPSAMRGVTARGTVLLAACCHTQDSLPSDKLSLGFASRAVPKAMLHKICNIDPSLNMLAAWLATVPHTSPQSRPMTSFACLTGSESHSTALAPGKVSRVLPRNGAVCSSGWLLQHVSGELDLHDFSAYGQVRPIASAAKDRASTAGR